MSRRLSMRVMESSTLDARTEAKQEPGVDGVMQVTENAFLDGVRLSALLDNIAT